MQGAFESFLKNLSGIIGGGGEEPKPKKDVYTSKEQINRDNKFARDFLTRKGAPSWLANNSVVARNVGDPMPQFVYQGTPPVTTTLQTSLPNGVSVEDVFQTNEGQYGYLHPQQGTFIQVDPQAIYQKYGAKK